MDLSLQNNGIVSTWNKDDVTGMTTITFYDSTKTTVLGDIIIESARLPAFLDSLKYTAIMYFPVQDYAQQSGHRTIHDRGTTESETKWV
jgi:hypothetical protein